VLSIRLLSAVVFLADGDWSTVAAVVIGVSILFLRMRTDAGRPSRNQADYRRRIKASRDGAGDVQSRTR